MILRRFFLALFISVSPGLLHAQTQSAESATTASYVPLTPPFVVNIQDGQRSRFLQVTAQVQITAPDVAAAIQQHMAPIRDAMIMLLSDQKLDVIRTVKGKEALRQEALVALQKVMQDNIGKPGIDAVYFTGFVIQ